MKVQNFWKAMGLYTDTRYIILKLTILEATHSELKESWSVAALAI